ncbi:ABC-F family ATP-binding cassette domain-containing protein [Aristophania vespae]|uniref:ABC-F family ATP-binding cassette domain-containing protein n=1 Tax=Aristophania vespae TaxID=2697033 RepID=UPI0023513942|nr:ATP-binding cassette domain-containing protein [Aristophania vespae]UMM63195.1 ABC transporter ATP-binding protein uup [Aristophania vespae]
MSAPILNLQNISYTLGGRPLLEGANLAIEPGHRLCLVGRNGSGKSTLLRIAAGEIHCDDGERFIQPGIKIHYLPQEPDFTVWKTTYDAVCDGLPEEEHYKARSLLTELGLTGDEDCRALSGGESRRCALAQALAKKPDLLLLDEPTNHLDLPCIMWLERELLSLGAAIVVISHDRRFLETICQSVLWLHQGETRTLEANFSHFEQWRDEQLELAEREAHKLSRQIAREEDWMRYGVTARRKRNVRRVAELAQLREARREINAQKQGSLKIEAQQADNTSKIVISAQNISWSYGTKTLVKDFSLKVLKGEAIGLCGANGAGKTTLLKLLTGLLTPQTGEVTLSPSLKLISLDQQRSILEGDRSVADVLTGGHGDIIQIGQEKRHVIGYMKDFLFRPEQARTPVSHLSGGERGRLALACALAKPSNLLVLDEPTNDLDLETLDLLQEMLSDYNGTILLVSHDRDFLDRLATSVITPEEDGVWVNYAGGYSDMLAQRRGTELNERKVLREARSETEAKNATTSSNKAITKLSYKEQRELNGLPDKIASLEADIKLCRRALSDADLYTRDPHKFEKITLLLEQKEAELTHAEERWLELEAKQEELRLA